MHELWAQGSVFGRAGEVRECAADTKVPPCTAPARACGLMAWWWAGLLAVVTFSRRTNQGSERCSDHRGPMPGGIFNGLYSCPCRLHLGEDWAWVSWGTWSLSL